MRVPSITPHRTLNGRSDSDSDSVGGSSQDDDTSLTPSGSESVVDEDDFDTGNPKIRTGTM